MILISKAQISLYQVPLNFMGEACGTNEEHRVAFRVVCKYEEDVERRTEVGWACIRMMRLGIGPGDSLSFGLHKMQGKS